MWNVATASLKPGETNVHCILMAQAWKLKHNSPFESAVDKATERKKERRVQINAKGQKQKANSKR